MFAHRIAMSDVSQIKRGDINVGAWRVALRRGMALAFISAACRQRRSVERNWHNGALA